MNSLIDINRIQDLSRKLSEEEMLNVFKYVKARVIEQKEKPKKNQWEQYWGEILKNGDDHPTFFLKKKFQNIYRLNGVFAEINDDSICVSVLQEILNKINSRFLEDCDFLIEFGAGTGSNIKYISELNKNISIFGSDFSESSLGILKRKGINNFFFDMKNPSLENLPKVVRENLSKTAFLTSGSMEQLGASWVNFINFARRTKPAKIISIEPIYEYYSDSEFDTLAKRFHVNKKYFSGYVDFLKENKIDLIEYRHKFGTLFDEGFNTVISYP